MFGIAPLGTGEREDYDVCVKAVCEALNGADEDREWTEDDIVRAHRVGQGKPGEPKTMIVKFKRWKDKMMLIRDKEFRGKLESRGVRVANDLTRRQADMVAMARREGKVAFFVRGKLTIGPHRLDSRNDAQVTAGVKAVSERNKNPTPSHHDPDPSSRFPTQEFPPFGARDATNGSGVSPALTRDNTDSLARATDRTSDSTHPLTDSHSHADTQASRPRASGGSTSAGRGRQQAGIYSDLRRQPSHLNKSPAAGSGRTLRSSTSAWK